MTTRTPIEVIHWMTLTRVNVSQFQYCQTVLMKRKSVSLSVSPPLLLSLDSPSAPELEPSVSLTMMVSFFHITLHTERNCNTFYSAATSVTIGLQETSYSVYETDEYQVVCAEVLSGDIAGRNIVIEYSTESDTAEGRLQHSHRTERKNGYDSFVSVKYICQVKFCFAIFSSR